MKPKLTEVRKLELLASDQVPSLEGAWWIMLQTAESIYNLAVEESRDPVNNAVLSEFWQDVSNAVAAYVSPDSVRSLPYDDLMQLISYCGDQLQAVVKNPRHSIVKVDKMVRPNRVKNTGSKTMDWLGKQPGKTIKEKLSGKNKMLTQVNEYTYDIKENQVAMVLYKLLMKRISDRVNQGINVNGYDSGEDSPCINKMMRIKKKLRNTELVEVKHMYHTQANNVLLADKNYSVLWKAYLEMCKYDKKLLMKWENALQLYVQALYISLNAVVAACDEVKAIEDRINFTEETANNAKYILGCETENPLVFEIELLENRIVMKIYKPEIVGISAETPKKHFEFIVDNAKLNAKLNAKRGCPLTISTKGNNLNGKIDVTADMSGIYAFVSYCIDLVQNEFGSEIHMSQNETEELEGTCTFDIASNGKYFAVDNEHKECFTSKRTAVYVNSFDEREIYKTSKDSDYSSADELIYVRDAINKDLRTEALKNVLEEISQNVTLNMDDYFIYTIPDALEEFSQKSLKQCVNSWFPRTLPVWRSVAALTGIITDEACGIQKDDAFLSVDLKGETATIGLLTVKFEPRVNTFVCNHYPPFPQYDSGDEITEDAFFANYLRKYGKSHRIEIDEDTILDIINEGKMYRLLHECTYISHTVVSDDKVTILKVEFDDNVLKKCTDEWLDNFEEFWKDIKRRLPMKGIQYGNFLSDCMLQHISKDDIATIIAKKGLYKGTFVSSSKDVSEGAFVYKDRLRGDHLPTWTEYLPKLSLQVTREGRYEELELIDNEVSFDVMGECNEHPVPERMLLSAGIKEFRFPLKKEDISRNAAMIEAYVTDKSFPLEENITVELLVRYKYGFDNSYELILKPVDTKNSPFEQIVVEWQTERKAPKIAKYPIYLELTNYDKVLKDINKVQYKLKSTLNTVERFLVNYDYDNVCRLDFARLGADMTNQIFRIRNIIIHDEILEVQKFIDDFYNSTLLIYLKEIADMIPNKNIPDDFFNNFSDSKDYEYLVCSTMQLIYSFGAKIPMDLQKYLLDNYETMDVVHKDNILLNMFFMNSENSRIMELILLESQKLKKMDPCIRELSSLCWFDSKMIYKLSEYPAFVKGIIEYISNYLKGKAKKGFINPNRMKNHQKRYLRYIEMILAILRLREDEDFDMLKVDSRESRELARYIRTVDEAMQHPHSKIKLKVNKPEALRNMSDVAYAVDMYLTGNEGVDSIEVISVESD